MQEDAPRVHTKGIPVAAEEELALVALDTAARDLSAQLGIAVPTSTDEVKGQLDDWCPERAPRGRPHVTPRTVAAPVQPRRRRRREYAAFQAQWDHGRSRVLKKVLSGDDIRVTPARPEGTHAFWRELFSRSSPEDARSPSPLGQVDYAVMAPVTPTEVSAPLAATQASAAPGVDGRRCGDLKALAPEKLAWVANACLSLGTLPPEWMKGKTTLIPKTNIPRARGITGLLQLLLSSLE